MEDGLTNRHIRNNPPGPGFGTFLEHIADKGLKKMKNTDEKSDIKGRSGSRSVSPKKVSRSPRRKRSSSRERRRRLSRDRFSPSRSRYRRSSPERTRRSKSRERYRRRERRDLDNPEDHFRSRARTSRSLSPKRQWSPKMQRPQSPPPAPQQVVPMEMQQTTFAPTMFNEGYNVYQNQYSAPQFNTAPPPPPQFSTAYPPAPTWSVPMTPDYSSHTLEPVYHQQGNVQAWSQPPVQQQIQQIQQPITPTINESSEDELKRKAAVAQEVKNQKEELKKQRNDYLKKASNMKKELKMLKDQMIDLVGSGMHSSNEPPSPTTKGYIEENQKLQNQIQKKINTIENVIDMLSGIIGEEGNKKVKMESPKQSVVPKVEKKNHDSESSSSSSSDDSSPERLKTKVIESMKNKREIAVKEEQKKTDETSQFEKKINYCFYDPEMHWCKICNVFPKSAKDYLTHLHSKEHMNKIEGPYSPWHEDKPIDEFPVYPNSMSKRVPIRGLQFFEPATAWYCQLCKFWIGDLHCASRHLKSQMHWKSYNEFFEKNLTYETDWIAERQRALDLQKLQAPPPPQITSVGDVLESIPLQLNSKKTAEKKKKKKKESDDKKDKKKKKRSKKRKKENTSSSNTSSSSSSSSENESKKKKTSMSQASSIRVAMRNIKKPNEETITVPPAPPQIKFTKKDSGNSNWESNAAGHQQNSKDISDDAKKKDDLMIAQWNTPQPIISESEKKLLEQLKGKLKSKPPPPPPPLEETKKTSEDATREKRLRTSTERSPARNRKRSKSSSRARKSRSFDRNRRSRSMSRGRRSRSNSRGRRSRSISRGRYGRYDRYERSPYRRYNRRFDRSVSRSPRRRRSYSRSRSRSPSHRRVEKPIVRYGTEFRPRVPDNDHHKKSKKLNEDESERKKSPAPKKVITGKKLPFIGRMPVLAKKQQELKKNATEEQKQQAQQTTESTNVNNISNPPLPNSDPPFEQPPFETMMDYEDLMPDPMQFVKLMGPPPPPPKSYDDDKEILPPGIDETETEFVPKPINDAPIARKGPLPRDFEEALDIIFPDRKPEDVHKFFPTQRESDNKLLDEPEIALKNQAQQLAKEGIHVVMMDESATKSNQISDTKSFSDFLKENLNSQSFAKESMALSEIPAPPFPADIEKAERNKEHIMKEISRNAKNLEKERRQQELDDLAMLGIDADDLAAQCI